MAGKKRHRIIKFKQLERFFEELLTEGKIEVANIGVFSIKTMKPRTGFNPGSGIYENFPMYNKVSFEPSQEFKNKLDTPLYGREDYVPYGTANNQRPDSSSV